MDLGHRACSQKVALEWDSIWRAKCSDFHWEMKYQEAGGTVASQKVHLEWASACEARM